MGFFVRHSRAGNWDGVSEDTPEDLSFPTDVLADLLNGESEVSVWEVSSVDSRDLSRVVAALHSREASDLSDMTFRVISDWLAKRLSLRMKKTSGTSLDNGLNHANKHWVIEIPTIGEAIKLAKAFKQREPMWFGKAEVMRHFAFSLQQKWITTEKVRDGLWKKLIDGRYLTVVAEEPPPSAPERADKHASRDHHG